MSTSASIDVWAHPLSFAVNAEAQAERLAASGVQTVRLAGLYHAGRWLLTTSSPGRVAYLEDAAATFRLKGTYRVLSPVPSRPQTSEAFEHAAQALRAAGVGVAGWLVALHNSPLAQAHPDLAVHNVTGVRYQHALCPAQPLVRAYAAALAADLAGRGVDALDIEALSYLGWPHNGHHERIGVALRPVDIYLLSLCVCPACAARFAQHDVDVDEVTRTARAELSRQCTEPRTADVGTDVAGQARQVLGDAVHRGVQRARAAVVRELVALTTARAGVPVDLRVTGDAYAFTGKSAGELADLVGAVDRVTVTSLTSDLDAVDHELDALQHAGAAFDQVTVGLSLLQQHMPSSEHWRQAASHLAARGVTRLSYYAYDLAPAGHLSWLRGTPTGHSRIRVPDRGAP